MADAITPSIPPLSPPIAPLETVLTLFMDDEPLGPLLYGESPFVPPSPTDPVDRWVQAIDRSDACACAASVLVSVLPSHRNIKQLGPGFADCLRKALELLQAHSPGDFRGAARLISAIAATEELAGNFAEAEQLFREVLAMLRREAGNKDADTEVAMLRLVLVIKASGRLEESKRMLEDWCVQGLLEHGRGVDFDQLRLIAFGRFEKSDYTGAELICRALAMRGYELASTYCHIARLCFLTNRDAEARDAIARAEEHVVGAASYVPLRIYFLRTLCGMLDGGGVASLLAAIKTGINVAGACNDWKIQCVLEHVRPRLQPEQYVLMSALAQLLCNGKQSLELTEHPGWRDIQQNVSPRCG